MWLLLVALLVVVMVVVRVAVMLVVRVVVMAAATIGKAATVAASARNAKVLPLGRRHHASGLDAPIARRRSRRSRIYNTTSPKSRVGNSTPRP